MHREVLPHPAYSPDLAPSDFHLFGPLKEALGGKRRDDDEVQILCNDDWTNSHRLFRKGRNEGARAVVKVYRGAGRICIK